MQVKFTPGSLAAYLLVQYNGCTDVWIWYNEDKGAINGCKLLREEHPLIQEQISMHFTRVFSMSYTERSEYMERVQPWYVNIEEI